LFKVMLVSPFLNPVGNVVEPRIGIMTINKGRDSACAQTELEKNWIRIPFNDIIRYTTKEGYSVTRSD
jgi:hypothetical protein